MLLVWERRFCIFVHISVVAYIVYSVYEASNKYDGLLNVYDFESGWSFIPREKDMSNYEWHYFYNFFWSICPWYISYIAVDWIVYKHMSISNRRYSCLLFSLVLLSYILGWRSLALLFSHSIFMFIVSFLQSKVAIWIVSVALISTLNFEPFISWMRALNLDDPEGKSYYIVMFTLALVHLRYTSFCLERVEHLSEVKKDDSVSDPHEDIKETDKLYMEREKEKDKLEKDVDTMKFSLIDAFVYIFYFPLFFTGPVMTYNEFLKQMNESSQKSIEEEKATSIAFHGMRMIFWAFFNEFILHFLYFNALQHNLSVIQDMDLWTLAGIGYCQGQFFMNKYTVMFGLPSVVARISGIEPPSGPKCVAHIYTYSDMWKYFDRGMYSFLKRYIYIPLGGSQGNFLQKLMYSSACFIFVYIWHGIEFYIFLWTLFNFIGISLEVLGKWIEGQKYCQKFKNSKPSWYLRFQGLVIVPLFIMSAFTAFCFFGGSVIGYIFYEKFILQGSMKSWSVVIFTLYCCIQSSMEIHRWQRLKEKTA